MVWNEFTKLVDAKFANTFLEKYFDKIIDNLHQENLIKEYCLYHDIGKPFCLEIDENGNKHYPNHALISSQLYSNHFNNDIISNLIKRDMDYHLLKFEDIISKCDIKDNITLLCVSLAEIYANRQMFSEQSFKIKYKCLEKKVRKILNYYFEKPYIYIFTRTDLSRPQQLVQSAHSIFEISKICKTYIHPSVIALQASSEKNLYEIFGYLKNNNIKFVEFYEPDIGNKITSICCHPIYGEDRKKFSNFKLISGE
jgi:hypothetical protein